MKMVVVELGAAQVLDLSLESTLVMILIYSPGSQGVRRRAPDSRLRKEQRRLLPLLQLKVVVGLKIRVVRRPCYRELLPCPWILVRQVLPLPRRGILAA